MASAVVVTSCEVGEAIVAGGAVNVAATATPGLEQKKFEYFSSISPMARRIMLERQKIREKYGPRWDTLEPREQEEIIDNWMVDPQIRSRYNLHRSQREETVCYPRLQLQTGQKVVHFGEEDITWQDEHSAPFSWETKSQMEFNFASIAASEQGVSVQSEQRQPVKTSQGNHQLKTSQGGLPTKPLQNGKTPSIDGLTQVRKEESSSFWKLSNERSRLEGEQSDYQYVTPSQIKSMEKGEKPLPSYLRQESLPKDKDENKSEKPRVKKQERIINTNVSSVFIDLDRPRTSQPSVSVCDGVSTHGHTEKSPDKKTVSKESVDEERDDSCASDAPLFSQINTSSSILKTGFDFLDNW
ncbi:uncharacterized protein C1orf198 homolog [Rhincodon typus]|uniref:uncharacterized protein C1orf198 homolog n=1 Tax=Rhincodon typus TaxID=259920 RepID=UPI0009A291FF|nr:uncharacterized protein C1orf198 homolog [Rhincodon typus]